MAEIVPEEHRDAVAAALRQVCGAATPALDVIAGGASGALTYRAIGDAGSFFVRVETIRGPLRNPHQYECMRIAADAGIAPPIRHLDEDAGVLVLPLLDVRPIAEHPGGPTAVAAAGGALLGRLHDTEPFPALRDHFDNIDGVLGAVVAAGKVEPGRLDAHAAAFAELRDAYPWDPGTFVSCHNDPNQFNLLYDGDRLWLVDWETASRNDPFVDLATMRAHLAVGPDATDTLLRAGLGRAPTELDHARLRLMSRVVELFAGCLLKLLVDDPHSPAGAYADVALQQFLDGTSTTEHRRALDVCRS